MSTPEETIRQLFDRLNQKGLLDLKPRESLSFEFRQMTERVGRTGDVFVKLRVIFTDQHRIRDFIQQNSSFGLTENDVMTIFCNYLIQYSLDYIEVMKRFFVENLRQGARIDRRQIDTNMTLGTLMHSLANECDIQVLLALIPYEFRNILGHGSYWWQNNRFCFFDINGLVRELTFAEFMETMFRFDGVYTLIFSEYLSRLPPTN
jgi:hypothetical protein